MVERVNRRDLIVTTAAELFMEHGYSDTSVRQIADAVGCTEAALYYHFKDGKRALFRAVVEHNMPELLSSLELCQDASSLVDLVIRLGIGLKTQRDEQGPRMRWIQREFDKLDEEQQALFHTQIHNYHTALSKLILKFVDNMEEAEQMAWVLICAFQGYAQLYYFFRVPAITELKTPYYLETLAHYFDKAK